MSDKNTNGPAEGNVTDAVPPVHYSRTRTELGKFGHEAVEAFAPLGAAVSGVPLIPWQESDDKSDYDKSTTITTSSSEKVRGHNTTFKSETDTDVKMEGRFDNHVLELVNGVVQERERRENERANHRNLNRMLTLVGALVLGFGVTYVLNHGYLGAWSPVLAPYSFSITILMDAGLALYGLVKHY